MKSPATSAGIPVPVLVGPTASGKTALTERIHESFPSVEIISADSRQIYIGMDIGTAKPSDEFLARIPHHLVDIIHPDVAYSAGKFERDATDAITAILERGHIPLVAGGTGFYIRALFEGLKAPAADPAVYAELEERMEAEGYDALLRELHSVDPDAARILPPENKSKTFRALACFYQTGVPYTRFLSEGRTSESAFEPVPFCLLPDRAWLYDRINQRTVRMVEDGLIEETQGLLDAGYDASSPGLRTVGYKEALEFLDGAGTVDEMTAAIQQATRRYAKRQMTWFRGQLPENTVYTDDPGNWMDWFSAVAATLEG